MVLDWLFEGQNAARLGKGLLLTAQISLISVALSCVSGTLFGLMLRADNRIVRFIGRLYLETVRIVPILVWLFGFYFGFAAWTGMHLGIRAVGRGGNGRFGARRIGIHRKTSGGIRFGHRFEPLAGVPLHRTAAKRAPRFARFDQLIHAHD